VLAWKEGVAPDPFDVNIWPVVPLEIAPKAPLLLY